MAVLTWTRQTPWRQGSILTGEAAQTLGLQHPHSPQDTCVVVIGHDCDLVNDALQIEPDVEIIVGRCLPKGDGNYFWARAPRTLHFDALKNGAPVVIELVATAKEQVEKQALAAFAPDSAYVINGQSLSALRAWLAVRYNRTALPDHFVNLLSQSKVDKRMAKLIEPMGSILSSVYFDLDRGQKRDHSDGSPYELSIVLVHPSGDDPEDAADQVDALATKIADLFSEKHYDQNIGQWSAIALKSCMAISEDDLTVSKARLLKQWRMEYMTLKAEEEQPGPCPA